MDSNTGAFLSNLLHFKNNYFEEHLRTTAPDTSRGVNELLLKDFAFERIFMNVLNFLPRPVYHGNTLWTMHLHHM